VLIFDWAKKTVSTVFGEKKLLPGNPLPVRHRIAGNVFFALFAAVGMVGAVGYGFNTVIKGPISGMTEVTRRTVAENTVITASRLAIVGATTQQTLNGDCDADGAVEPMPYRDAGASPKPAGGGYLPTGLLPDTIDPWKSEYGYCVWDTGSLSVPDAVVACGGATPRRLRGAPNGTQASIAIISAGRNKTFETSCAAYNPASPTAALVTKPAGSDDVVLSYTYAEANDLGNGLWKPHTNPAKTATTSTTEKNIQVEGAGTFTDKVVLTGGGLVLPGDPGDNSITGACNSAANDRQMRRNTSTSPPTLEICDFTGGLGWVPISGGSGGGGGGTTGYKVAHWKLNETTGTVAEDSAGNNNGTLLNGAVWNPTGGMLGGAIELTAASNHKIQVPLHASLEPTAITVSAWVKPLSVPTSKSILHKPSDTTNPSYLLGTSGGSGPYVFGLNINDVPIFAVAPVQYTAVNQWTHIIGTYDPAATAPQVKLYINGSLVASNTATDNIVYGTNKDLFIGSASTANSRNFDGAIDDVRIYNYAMSATEAMSTYQLSSPEINNLKQQKAGMALSWGPDTNGMLGNGASLGLTTYPSPLQTSYDYIDITSGEEFGCGVKKDGTVWCWGADTAGKLGNGPAITSAQQAPYKISNLKNIVQVSASAAHACALEKNGTAWCWGANAYYELGDGTNVSKDAPVRVNGINDFTYVEAGANTTCGLRQNGEIWCWGRGWFGALGNGGTADSAVPVKASNVSDFTTISGNGHASSASFCATTKRGLGFCWGFGNNGNIGNGSTASVNVPTQVSNITDFVKIETHNSTSCGIRADRSLWCWGRGNLGQMGNNTTTAANPTPVQVLNISDVVDVGVYTFNVCAVTGNGELYCWGDGDATHMMANGPNVTAAQLLPYKAIGGNFYKLAGGFAGFALADTKPHNTAPIDIAQDKFSSSALHNCVLKADNTLWCWGDNTTYNLGDTTIAPKDAPVSATNAGANNGRWSSISAGNNGHTCAINVDGNGYCWGRNTNGEVGNGATGGSVQMATVLSSYAGPWSKLFAGNGTTCGIKPDGTAWCWGIDTSGQLGNGATGTQTSPAAGAAVAGNLTWKTLSLNSTHACGITTDDRAYCWGSDSTGQLGNDSAISANQVSPVPVLDTGRWKTIAAGALHTCGIKMDGTAWCWGLGGNGRLGNGAITNTSTPVLVADPGPWLHIVAGSNKTCGIKMDGSLWCWGMDQNGALGNGAAVTADQTIPVPVDGGGSWIAIGAGGGSHTCGMKSDNSVWCWGSDSTGLLGNGPAVTANQHSPYPVTNMPSPPTFTWGPSGTGATPAADLNIGTMPLRNSTNNTSFSLSTTLGARMLESSFFGNNLIDALDSGTAAQISLSGPNFANTFGFDSQSGSFGFARGQGWISGLYNDLEISRTGNVGVGTFGDPTAKLDIAGGLRLTNDATCTVAKAGTIRYNAGLQYCNSAGSWVALQKSPSSGPTPWDLTKVGIGADSQHSCGIKSNGTLWCWGYALDGRLGNGSTSPDQPSPIQIGVDAWAHIAVGDSHTCAIKADRTLWCWGDDGNGVLGNGAPTADQLTPLQIGVDTWALISTGGSHTCGIKTNGTLWCWGGAFFGKLGNGATSPDQTSPVQIGTDTWKTVFASSFTHTCGIKTDGTLWCWGSDASGQIGNGGTTGDQLSPVQIGTDKWADVSAGDSHTCAIKDDATLWCWGSAGSGRLGNGTTTPNVTSPAQIGTDRWIKVDASVTHTCGVKTDGTLWCWGNAALGRLGNGTTTPSVLSPQQIGTDIWADIITGGAHSCGIKTDGSAWCWGYVNRGQLGNGTTTPDVLVPGAVLNP
jgi:alpha-tubulin suppressor-like RCC1 family protein